MVYLTTSTGTIADVMTAITSVFTGIMTMLGKVVETVNANPLLLLFCILPLVGIAIGFFKRLAN